jgi:hypothetical protein
MAIAATPLSTEPAHLTRAEQQFARWLRLFAVLFAIGAVMFLLRPDGTVQDIDRIGALLGMWTLPASPTPAASDFWLALGVANMTTIAVSAWLAAGDVRGRRALVYPIVASKLTSSATGVLLFVRWTPALPFLMIALVDLPIAFILLRGLRATRT